jgi:hypothetical protein
MSQPELLRRVVQVLDAAHVAYMLTGSLASSAQGEPRSSHDIDLVVVLTEADAPRIVDAFPAPEFYVSLDAALDAIRRGSMFNLLWIDTGDKVDFWLLTSDPFDQSRFHRRSLQPLLGEKFYVSSPEDTILMKLRWCQKAGGSEKQFTDALRVYEVQRNGLDENYLDDWAATLGIVELLIKLRENAEAL